MPVPETTVDLNYGFIAGKNNVRLARKLTYMKPVPEASRVKAAPELDFDAGVFPSDPSHNFTSLFLREYVRHEYVSKQPS